MRTAREEAEMVIFESVAEALKKCKLRASQVSCASRDAAAALATEVHCEPRTAALVHAALFRI